MFRVVPLALSAFALCLCASPARAQTQHYELDPVHTRVLVAVSHAGFSQALGTVSGSTGELDFDPNDWTTARLHATVPLARLDLGDPDWNAAALGRRLLDADDHPQAQFVSTRVTPRDARHAEVCGELTLRGTTAPLCLEVVLNAMERHPMPPFRRTVGFSATGTLSRAAFGVAGWKALIGDTVELRIEAEAVRRRDDDEDVPAPTIESTIEPAIDPIVEPAEPAAEPPPPAPEPTDEPPMPVNPPA